MVQSVGASQPWLRPHFLLLGAPAQDPPQSTSVSVPFSSPSVQEGAWQRPPVQTLLVQSLALTHLRPVPHLPQVLLPPQSTSVSPPFCTVSVQVAALHVSGLPVQTPSVQSLATAQVLVAPHLPHEPPQSTSVSVPFLMVSLQVAATQVCEPEQTGVAPLHWASVRHWTQAPAVSQTVPPSNAQVVPEALRAWPVLPAVQVPT